MIKILKLFALFGLLALTNFVAVADQLDEDEFEQEPNRAESLMARLGEIDPIDEKKWGIHKGCLDLSRIKKISFIDDQSAIISLGGKKKAILRLGSVCTGIKSHGFMLIRNNAKVCERFTRFKALVGGMSSCIVAAIDPYVEIEDPPEREIFD
ncbi:MAG: hypothetical protein P8N61_04965 [Porticoccaceae bacterium]|nr:hypothetical protein [Porticoccaceae bacterium]